ncbi:MAG: 1-deoxy-D-xylulose-5-phosphate reductoisomerase [Actinomycetota bacterium]|nr:1-deoxy-D-xylulose-5-phosphate reductoisomerase [Actinomycetota bacterium]
MKKKRIVILGSTGSIGRSALNVIGRYPDRFEVAGLAAFSSIETIAKQINTFGPIAAALYNEDAAEGLARKTGMPVWGGMDGLCKIARLEEADFVISAISGAAGLLPTLAAIRAGKDVGLANKEVLVTAGAFVMDEARRYGVKMLPIDSEHSAVFQCMERGGYGLDRVKNIILTASGGPFFGKNSKYLATVKAADALKHPNWEMGRKITIDSATLMNKGLEVIEACHLFGVGHDKVKVLVHPQSIIHSMVEFVDGSIISQLSKPDMRSPIAYALSYPDRLEDVIPQLDLTAISGLTFAHPDLETFPCLAYAYKALGAGGTATAVLNAANEVAVVAFLEGGIGFNDIPAVIEEVMSAHPPRPVASEHDALEADTGARAAAHSVIKRRKKV